MKRFKCAALLLALLALAALSGCRGNELETFGKYDDSLYSVGNGTVPSVYKIGIVWTAGDVIVQTSATADSVTFEEETLTGEPVGEDAVRMHYRCSAEGGALDIRYAASGADLRDLSPKRLTVTLPALLRIAELDVETVAAAVKVSNVRGTSLKAETRTGGVLVYGYGFTDGEIETGSGDVILELGGLAPAQGFGFSFETKRGILSDEFGSAHLGVGAYQYGTPTFRFEVETVSGGLYLKKTI